jgi:DNA-binding NarL/FixJ family response regulator
MTSAAFAPELRTTAETRRATETGLDLLTRVQGARNEMALRIVIASQQPILRHGLRALIADEPDLQVVGETDDGAEAIRLSHRMRPDVVLVDLSLPTVDGISATRMIREELHDTQVVVMTGVDEGTSAVEAIRAGAAAYLLKGVRTDDLLRTIRGAASGQVALPAKTVARMVRLVDGRDVLSRRETEVLTLVARGLANKHVAQQLRITESTVKTHLTAIFSKLGLVSRTQLALYAARTGLVVLDQIGLEPAIGSRDSFQRA